MKYIITFLCIGLLIGGLYWYETKPTKNTQNYSIVTENSDTVIHYISQHISDLSPEKEVLGGTFYVTNITLDNGSGTVMYEDGHNAYSADFVYTFTQTGEVSIANFEIR